jgi:hydroxymethylglutaryl-CoA lyase
MTTHLVILEEQGLRDGLQTLAQIVPAARKLDYIERLVDAGLRRIQVASFVHPLLVPAMADAEDICRGLRPHPEVVYSGLALNVRGVERAVAAGLKHVSISISASDTHSRKNAGMGLREAHSAFQEMARLARSEGVVVRGGIQCAFGCRYEGRIAPEQVLDMVKRHLDTSIDEIALADSTGMANPAGLRALMTRVLELAGEKPVSLHLHNTENKGLANVYAALEAGVRQFDTAFGGLGGCPFIQNASGNIATEDTAHMLHQMGFDTGIDIGKVAAISRDMEAFLGHELPGQLYKLLGRAEVQVV